MLKIRTQLPLVGKGAVSLLIAKLRRQEQMESWEDAPDPGTRWIPLGKGQRCIVDESRFEFLNQWNWHCNNSGYVVRFIKRKMIMLHSLVLSVPLGMERDHRDRNRLNNVKSNLRPCTKLQNQGNRWKSRSGLTSRFKGVSFSKRDKTFAAYGREGFKSKRLGSFRSERDAAAAYNNWAMGYFGKFALLNPV